MRRKTVVIGVSYLCGLFLASFLSPVHSVYVIVATAATAPAVCIMKRDAARYIAVASAFFCVGVMLYTSYTVNNADKLLALDGQEVEITGRVADFTHLEGDMVMVALDVTLDGVDTTIGFVADDTGTIGYDDTVTIKATVEKLSDNIYAQTTQYNNSKEIFLTGGFARILDIEHQEFSFRKSVLSYRDFLGETIMQSCDSEVAGFLVAMLCGDKSQVSDDLSLALSRTGLIHILSVSGLHLVIIVCMVMQVLRLMGLGKALSFVITQLLIVAFAIFAGGAVSVLRAAFMISLHNMSLLTKRRYDPLSSLVLACVIITALSPYSIRNSSLILSAAGTLSMTAITPKVIPTFNLGRRFYKTKCTVISLGVLNVVMFPLNILFFSEVSVVAIVANIVLLPICSVALCLVATVAVCGAVSVVAKPLLMLAEIITRPFLAMVNGLAELEFSSVAIGYRSVKLAVFSVIVLTLGAAVLCRKDTLKMCMVCLSGYVACMSCAFVNQNMAGNILRIYRLRDDDSSVLVVAKGNECIAVNLSGDGEVSDAVGPLLQSKGIRHIRAFYDLSDSTSAHTRFCDSLSVNGLILNADYDGFASSWVYDGGIVIEYGDADICISPDEIYDKSYDVTLSCDMLTDNMNERSYALFSDAELITINENKVTVRGLQYGFDE